jgi:hypothetical protein
MEIRLGGMRSYRFQEERATPATIRDEPTPEVCTFRGSSDCPPSTANKREVKEDDGVRCAEADIDNVIGSEIAVHDPSLSLNKLLLNRYPLIPRCRNKAWLPKELVQLDDREPRDLG